MALEGAGAMAPWDAGFGLGAAVTAPVVLMVLGHLSYTDISLEEVASAVEGVT